MEKHFRLTDNTLTTPDGVVLHQIECIRDCRWAKAGDLGGWIEKEDNLSGNAWVCDNAQVCGDAWVYGNARIGNTRDYCCFQIFGSRNATTTAFRQKDGSVLIRCGCFLGNLDEFIKKVKGTHGANQYGQEYIAIANVIKVRFGIA